MIRLWQQGITPVQIVREFAKEHHYVLSCARLSAGQWALDYLTQQVFDDNEEHHGVHGQKVRRR